VNYGILLELFLRFLKIGFVGFGGGWAILPLIEREIVQDAGWLSESEYLNLVAIAGSTPGPIAVNAATYIGLKLGGPLGAIVATSAVILPPFIIISLVVYFVTGLFSNPIVQGILNGLKAAVIGLIAIALYTTAKQTAISLAGLTQTIILFSMAAFVILMVAKFNIHPLIALIITAALGAVLSIAKIW